MESQQTRTPLARREAMIFNFALPVIKGATLITATMGTADQAALNTNGAAIVAEAVVTDLKAQIVADGTLTIALQPDIARCIVIAAHNDSGGPLNMYEGTTIFRVVGTFRGFTQSEDISVTSSAANKEIANTKYRAWSGSKPFDTVTSITVVSGATTWPADTLKLCVGWGSKIGLPNKPYQKVAADFVKVMVDSAAVAVTTQYDSANDTFALATLADGKSIMINYWVNLSDIRRRLFGV